eukprot:CAMPEP_0206439082 /NCGR_PEP_ID=MMETSP0324_2-20121206/12005_1 /ASSEMBLY_ACC=CAM_ASM_000836 /TAXON_ID=2866 /ORGANISM="Crypthecodinium cohnii, Strain Seligo" /LENGTH=76 /DNA_ID=CAMNT_0053906647 /DNA_START=191 /DNA_END=418 /DNA_ORIENTATION=+
MRDFSSPHPRHLLQSLSLSLTPSAQSSPVQSSLVTSTIDHRPLARPVGSKATIITARPPSRCCRRGADRAGQAACV